MSEMIKQNNDDLINNYAKTNEQINICEMMRALAESTINQIMDIQADDLVEEGNYRNGYRDRSLNTSVGALNLKIPKLRRGTYFPDNLLTRYSRTEQALIGAVREMIVNGVSTRKVEKVAKELQVMSMSKSQISRLCKNLDETVYDLTHRSFSQKFPYLFLDATYIRCRNEGHVSSNAFVTAIGVGEDGYKHLLGFDIVDTETEVSWIEFLRKLRKRGINGVISVTSDAHLELQKAIQKVFCGATWQRCIVHFIRNVSGIGSSKKQRAIIGNILSTIFKEEDPVLVKELYKQSCAKIEALNKDAGRLMEEAEASVLAYLDFPKEHWTRIRTNNVQERLNREIKRRTNVVQVFPSRISCMRLVGAVLSEEEDKWLSKRWFGKDSIQEAYEEHIPKVKKYKNGELEEICKIIITEAERKALDGLRRVA